jgi:hypothetical protein
LIQIRYVDEFAIRLAATGETGKIIADARGRSKDIQNALSALLLETA